MEKVDLTYLQNMTDGSEELLEEMIGIFIEQVPEFIRDFRLHSGTGNDKAIASLAHKAKSSVSVVGLNRLASSLNNLEIYALEKKGIEIYTPYIDNFESVCNQAVIDLQNIIAKNK